MICGGWLRVGTVHWHINIFHRTTPLQRCMDTLHAALWRCVAELVPEVDNPTMWASWCHASAGTCYAVLPGMTSVALITAALPGTSPASDPFQEMTHLWATLIAKEWTRHMSLCRVYLSPWWGMVPRKFMMRYFMVAVTQDDEVWACQWIMAHYHEIPRECEGKSTSFQEGEVTKCQLFAMEQAARRGHVRMGHLGVCRWLAEHFGLTPTDARAGNNHALCAASLHGHKEICAWLVHHFDLAEGHDAFFPRGHT